ncbi:hypothetical protein [Bathymodiolus japonicus methanotrophic gill symbiont]|uniref:hypothetical protein n=1 Tax=Bathymodiolus japonicus methanotrophic gill symbiont TaxID=113269 RepID=UPI001C8E6104|nr:hypothetical protein [Bathymodiolus japonicus methanotrophic gill symbiont]
MGSGQFIQVGATPTIAAKYTLLPILRLIRSLCINKSDFSIRDDVLTTDGETLPNYYWVGFLVRLGGKQCSHFN